MKAFFFMSQRKYHYIYKITNLLSGKIYIGKRYGVLSEPYYGSGKWIKRSIKKHGIQHFNREILLICARNVWEEMERACIREFESQNPDIGYNFADGGEGGDMYKGRGWKEISTPEIYQRRLQKKAERDKIYWTQDQRARQSEIIKRKQWSGERGQSRRKMLSEKVSGENNPSAKLYSINTGAETIVVKGLRSWCRQQGLIFDTVRKFVGKGEIKRTSTKDTSWAWSKTKQTIMGWTIEEINHVGD